MGVKKWGGTHWALLAGFVGAIGLHLSTHEGPWSEVFSPTSVGALLVQVATFVGALWAHPPSATPKVNPAKVSNPSRFKAGTFAVLVAAGAVASTCCATWGAGQSAAPGIVATNPTTDQVQAVRVAAIKAGRDLDIGISVAIEARRYAEALNKQGVIANGIMDRIDMAALRVAKIARESADAIETVGTAPGLASTVRVALREFDGLLQALAGVPALEPYVRILRTTLAFASGLAGGSAGVGGGR